MAGTDKRAAGNGMKAIRDEIRQLEREMKELGVRKVSCFNGGLSRQESVYNSRLFALKSVLKKARP